MFVIFLQVFLWSIVALVAVPVLVLAIEIVAACWPGTMRRVGLTRAELVRRPGEAAEPRAAESKSGDVEQGAIAPVTVIIPAHNEETGIAETIRSLLPLPHPSDRIVVVADNCTDRTAERAQLPGVTVVERFDADLRGKGFALACAVDYLRKQAEGSVAVVAIIDADCRASEGFINVIRAAVTLTGRPVQTLNLSDAKAPRGTNQIIAIFAMRVINLIRPLGMRNLGGPSRLMGTGMGIPWRDLRNARLASGNLVEDLQLGLDLAIAGAPAVFCAGARVTTEIAHDRGSFVTQKSRWEQGQLATLVRQTPRVLGAAVRQCRWDLLLMAADLTVPPLALLAALLFLALVVTTTATPLGVVGPMLAAFALTGLFLGSLLVAWASYCRWQVSPVSLLRLPLYLLQKVPVYLGLLAGGSRVWVRTARRTV